MGLYQLLILMILEHYLKMERLILHLDNACNSCTPVLTYPNTASCNFFFHFSKHWMRPQTAAILAHHL